MESAIGNSRRKPQEKLGKSAIWKNLSGNHTFEFARRAIESNTPLSRTQRANDDAKQKARKAAHGVLAMLKIAFTAVDFFGCFGPADAVYTTLFCPTGTQVCGALYRAECGHALDASDQTIVDLCLAGF